MTVITPDHGRSPRGATCAMRTRIQYQWSVLEKNAMGLGSVGKGNPLVLPWVRLHVSLLCEGTRR
jgi:hypothetical protein